MNPGVYLKSQCVVSASTHSDRDVSLCESIGEAEVKLLVFQTLQSDQFNASLYHQRKSLGIHWTDAWVDPRDGLELRVLLLGNGLINLSIVMRCDGYE
jgi:hypothetical protein